MGRVPKGSWLVSFFVCAPGGANWWWLCALHLQAELLRTALPGVDAPQIDGQAACDGDDAPLPASQAFSAFLNDGAGRGRGTTRDKEPVFLIVVFFSEVLYSEVDTARLAWNTAARMKTPRA